MDAVSNVFDSVRDALGGGNLTLWLILGGIVAIWLAIRAVKFGLKLALGAAGLALWLGTAPWAGQPVEGPVADCAAAEVATTASGWQTNLTKRITVEEVSADARCDGDGQGLAAGSAVVKLRTFYDVPFQTWDLTPEGATSRMALPL